MKSLAVLALFTTAAMAQSSSSVAAAPSPTANPLIPTGISSNCSSFLTSLNSDSTLSSCIDPIILATAQFGPTANTTAAPTVASVSSALDTLCAASAACPDSTIRSRLASFYTACTPELTGATQNTGVLRTYDVLFAITPFKQAVCTKGDDGRYCAVQIQSANSTAAAPAPAANGTAAAAKNELAAALPPAQAPLEVALSDLYTTTSLARRDTVVSSAAAALVPNTTTYRATNLVFLFLTPNLPQSALCTTCTRSVLTSFIDFQESVPYAPGLAASPLMGGQTALYQGVQSTCGASFLSGAVQAAGGIAAGLTGGAPPTVSAGALGKVGAVLAAVAVGFTVVL